MYQHSRQKSVADTKSKEERVKLKLAEDSAAKIDRGLSSLNADYENTHTVPVCTKEKFAVYERRDIELRDDMKHEKANI